MKDRVLKWIEQGCDYNTGILLLADSGHHRQLIRIIANRPHRYASKLLYELCKEAGIPYMDLGHADLLIQTNPGQADSFHSQVDSFNQNYSGQADSLKQNRSTIQAHFNHSGQADVKKTPDGLSTNSPDDKGGTHYITYVTDLSNEASVSQAEGFPTHLKSQSDSDFNLIPKDIQAVIREHSKLYMLRSQLHEQMANMPEDNQPDTVKKRKNLSDSIALLSPRIDLLFQTKEDFYLKGLKPDMAVLFPTIPPNAPQTRKETPLPDSANELKKLKKNLQSANVKDQNMLDYQVETNTDKPSPMPSGPKRLKLEQRIASRHNQIEAIDYKLLAVE